MNTDIDKHELEATVLQCLGDHYGITGSLSRLSGENINYLVKVSDEARYVFKIMRDNFSPGAVMMENAAVEHAFSNGFELEMPRIVKNRAGDYYSGINIRKNTSNMAILYNYIKGKLLSDMSDISMDLANNIGSAIALFDLAMGKFNHSEAHRSHRWDLAEAGQHLDKIKLVEDPDKRELLALAFRIWFSEAKPKLSALPQQFIHGDAHDDNILIRDGQVSGLLDFGDSGFNPTICELATCLPYLMMGRRHPMKIAGGITAAYHAIRPISDEEFSVLMPLVCGRLAVTVSIAAEHRQIDPLHPSWFISEDRAWDLLGLLSKTGVEQGIKHLL